MRVFALKNELVNRGRGEATVRFALHFLAFFDYDPRALCAQVRFPPKSLGKLPSVWVKNDELCIYNDEFCI